MLSFLYALIVALLVLVVAASFIMLGHMRRLRLVAPQVEPLQPQDVPEAQRQRLAAGLEQLLALGFEHPCAQSFVGQLAAGQPLLQHVLTLTHPRVPAAAYLATLAMPERNRHWSIHFASRTRDGRTLVTRNRSSITGPIPLADVSTHDVWLPDWPAVWQAHRGAMQALAPDGARWAVLPPAEWARLSAAAEAATFAQRLRRGHLLPAADGGHRVSLRWALPMLARAWRVAIPSSRPMVQDQAQAAAAPQGGAAAQAEAYEHEARLRRHAGWSTGAKWLLFFATAIGAALSFGLNMDLLTLAALLAVLLFHELGHYAAMHWAGYRDLKVFFLPFLGAAVTGRHDKPTVRQELAVLFAGPLPGLVLGLAALVLLPAGTLGAFGQALALMAVILNGFNLLPIHPLDGGKIFEILLLSRFPWLAFAGRVGGVLALGAMALAMDDTLGRSVLLGFVLVMLIGLPHQWREAQVARALRAAGRWGGMDRPATLQALFDTIGRLGYSRLAWPNQRLMVDALLPAALRPRLTRPARAAGLAVYAVALALPLLGLVGWGWRMQQEQVAVQAPGGVPVIQAAAAGPAQAAAAREAGHAQWLAWRGEELKALQLRVATAGDATRQWALLEEEMDQAADDLRQARPGELPAAEALLQQAAKLASEQHGTPERPALVALWRAAAASEPAARREHLRAAMAAYDAPASIAASASAPLEAGPLLRATLAWTREAGPGDLPAPDAQVAQALARAGEGGGPHERMPLLRYQVDRLLAAGQPEPALALARSTHERATARGDLTLQLLSAQLLVDTTLATAGPAAALQALDGLLPAVDRSGDGQGPSRATSLRQFGLWLAEAAGRRDWQRAQAARLPVPVDVSERLSYTQRALTWLLTLGQARPATLAEVDRAHWRGDEQAARDAVRRLLKRNPGFVAPLPVAESGSGALDIARTRMLADARRAAYQHYGLATRVTD